MTPTSARAIDETLAEMRSEMSPLIATAMDGVLYKARGLLYKAEEQRIQGLADVAEERAKGIAEVEKERAEGHAEVDARWAELHREIAAMRKYKEAQEGCIELNIGGYRFETSVQTLRRVPHTFFDAYFSGRYAQDVCNDGSIFVDRDGEHFGHLLEYMRDGHVSVAEADARPSISLLRALKREFGFYCIELCADADQAEVAYVMGGYGGGHLTSMERYDASSGEWSAAAGMNAGRSGCSACEVAGYIYVSGGSDGTSALSSVEKYAPSSDTWSFVAPLPESRTYHTAVAVGSAMYVLGGDVGFERTSTTSTTVFKYESAQDKWSRVAPMPAARRAFSACAIGSDIFVFGGIGNRTAQATVFKLDTVANEWSTLAPLPQATDWTCACALGSLVYIVGAGGGRETLRFDSVTEAWTSLKSTEKLRMGAKSFVLNGSLYVTGGLGGGPSVECYDEATNTWLAMTDMLESRLHFGAVTIRDVRPTEDEDLFDSLIAKASRRLL